VESNSFGLVACEEVFLAWRREWDSNSRKTELSHVIRCYKTLEDSTIHQIQEARVTVEVNTTPAVKGQVDQLNKQTDQDKSTKTKFSWGDLAKTGVSALLKYFSIAGVLAAD
jgi:hypothetical protein